MPYHANTAKTQFKKGLNGVKKAEIVSQEIDLSKRKVAKEGYAVKEELLPDWMKGDESKIFTKESMAKTAGLAKEKASQPVFPDVPPHTPVDNLAHRTVPFGTSKEPPEEDVVPAYTLPLKVPLVLVTTGKPP